jgi:hypothetical protein
MGQGNAFTPQSIKDQHAGIRRSVAPLLAMIDTEDPAFKHIAAALESMKTAGVELDEAAISIAVKLGKQKYTEAQPEAWKKRHNEPERKSIVYYIRRGDLIKIGTTVDPFRRFSGLRPDEILAFEPGGPELEASRHRQFSACRVTKRGEYFRPSAALKGHIESLREQHGPPDPAWPTVATLGSGSVRKKQPVELPEPTTGEMATAPQAAKLLNMSVSTIHGWAHRGVIKAAGKDVHGRPKYFVEQMRFLIDKNRSWMNHRPRRAAGDQEVQSVA